MEGSRASDLGVMGCLVDVIKRGISLDMRRIQYQGETLPFPLVLAFGQVLGMFHMYISQKGSGALRGLEFSARSFSVRYGLEVVVVSQIY